MCVEVCFCPVLPFCLTWQSGSTCLQCIRSLYCNTMPNRCWADGVGLTLCKSLFVSSKLHQPAHLNITGHKKSSSFISSQWTHPLWEAFDSKVNYNELSIACSHWTLGLAIQNRPLSESYRLSFLCSVTEDLQSAAAQLQRPIHVLTLRYHENIKQEYEVLTQGCARPVLEMPESSAVLMNCTRYIWAGKATDFATLHSVQAFAMCVVGNGVFHPQ